MKRTLLGLFTFLIAVCTVNAQILTEGFDTGSFPVGWDQSTMATDGGWIVGNAAAIASQYWRINDPADGSTFIATNDDGCNCDKSNDLLIFPAVDLSTATGAVFLEMEMIFAGGTYGGNTEVATLEMSTDGGATWNVMQNIDGNGLTSWSNQAFNVGSAAGLASVQFGIRYSDAGGWLFGMAINNVTLSIPPARNMIFGLNGQYGFAVEGGESTFSGSLTNYGGEALTSYDLTWSDGTNSFTDNITGVDIAPLETVAIEHTTPFVMPNSPDASISVEVSNPNGADDADMSDNSGSQDFVLVVDQPSKMLFLEESTGTWCPWCPRGDVFMNKMEEDYPESIAGVAVHVGQQTWPDPMQYDGDNYALDYAGLVGGFPTLVIDRVANPGIPSLGDADGDGIGEMDAFGEIIVDFTNNRPSPIGFDVVASIDGPSRLLTVDVTATTHSTLDASNYNINVLVTEDHVTGGDTEYRQANNYANNAVEPMEGYENLPNPVPGSQMQYNHTLRTALNGGISGSPGFFSGMIAPGGSETGQFSWTVPDEYDINELNVVVVVFDMDNGGAAYNSLIVREPALTTSIEDQLLEENVVKVFPNPISDFANIEINLIEKSVVAVQVMNSVGEMISSRTYGEMTGQNFLPFDASNLANGMYFVHVKVNDKITTKKITVAK